MKSAGKIALAAVLLASLSTCAVTRSPATSKMSGAKRPPNFIIIMADDMGYNGTSVYGGWIPTPNLEKLAAAGMKFTDFHSSGVVCSPTRAGLLTGRYQERAGIPAVITADPAHAMYHIGLQHREITFAEVLKQAGYATGVFGKWHLGYYKKYNPVHHGFDRFRGFISGNIDYISHYDRMGADDWWEGLEQVRELGYSTHLITRHSVKFIEENRDRPFCLYVAHEAVHSPFQGPRSRIERGPDKGKPPDAARLSKQEAYVQMMTEMDKGVGEIVRAVERLGLAENTLVVFFSDNGHAFLGPQSYKPPLRGKKGSVWEGGHRVPAIAWWPGKVRPGSTNRGLYISLDLMPTMLDLAGAAVPPGHTLDGISMKRALLNGEEVTARKLFWKGRAMRDGPWKLVTGPGGGLFNLDRDLAERDDLSGQYPERLQEMTAAIERWQTDVATGATRQPDPPEGVKRRKAGKKAVRPSRQRRTIQGRGRKSVGEKKK